MIDDAPATVELLTDMLGSQGYRVLSAPDGRQGIELARTKRPNLIVLDLPMPETPGFEVVRELRMHPESREIPIPMLRELARVRLGHIGGEGPPKP